MAENATPRDEFKDQYTRKLMVEWCNQVMTFTAPAFEVPALRPGEEIYQNYAREKGWVSSKDGRILSPGWKVAVAFLKR